MIGLKKIFTGAVLLTSTAPFSFAQLQWQNTDAEFGPLPSSVHVYKTTDSIEGKPNIAYYVIAELTDRSLHFTTDTTFQRRLTPLQFYHENNQPLLVMNGTFFDFATNRNLNVVMKDGNLLSYNVHTIALRGKDTLKYAHPFRSAIGINQKRKTDIAWIYADSSARWPYGAQVRVKPQKDSFAYLRFTKSTRITHGSSVDEKPSGKIFKKWKMQTAMGGGPVLIQNGKISITNNEEMMFSGKAVDDKHPRSAMGYTADNKLIFLVVQGRFPGVAEGVSLNQLAKILLDLGCLEALNLDGGGSSCLLINGKETITPSDKTGQRPVPAVFIIHQKNK
jgi:hypothetical protein